MANVTGETKEPLRVAFARRLKLEFHCARITSDAGLLAYRKLDNALGLIATAASALAEGLRGKPSYGVGQAHPGNAGLPYPWNIRTMLAPGTPEAASRRGG